ncbi:LOW QUALITY PROTEIN: hypothetical protein RJ640_004814, partial [Escallonia rubra]
KGLPLTPGVHGLVHDHARPEHNPHFYSDDCADFGYLGEGVNWELEKVEKKEEMNTDITASAKPEYPVVDRNPPFTKTVANFNTLDYLRLVTIAGVSVTVGYLSGIKPNIRGPSMVTGGLIGVMGGFMYAYQNSAGRLMGFFPNDGEVARLRNGVVVCSSGGCAIACQSPTGLERVVAGGLTSLTLQPFVALQQDFSQLQARSTSQSYTVYL